ncbi:chromosomal replication initiator protein DnaA [Slackia heliotrinireducens]|uniref:chromosomal replication initiator protein DnaA n=1 Tax=Slackia heliotrinireducens TaxID=84110 RepID=UPI003314F19E
MDITDLYATWNSVCNQIKTYSDVNPHQVDAYFSRLHPQAISEGFLVLTADTAFFKMQVEKRYLTHIIQALKDTTGIDFMVEIEVDETEPAPQPVVVQQPVFEPQQDVGLFPGQPISTQLVTETEPQPSCLTGEGSEAMMEEEIARSKAATLASSLTFESFVTGNSNMLAYSLAVAVAEAPGQPNTNPLFIYGKSGLGKTHLLRAIQNYVMETNPTMDVVYIDSSEFLAEYTSAVTAHERDRKSFQNFQNRFLDADMLLIDDVQFFQGKSATLDIVFQLFNHLVDAGKQVVLSADRAPKMIDIDERYKSRFNQGATVNVNPPELEVKLGIIKNFINEYEATSESGPLNIPDDIQIYIAEISSSNVRELKSAVTKVIFQIRYSDSGETTLSEVKTLLEDHFSSGITKRLNIGMIQHEVEQYYKVTHAELIGVKRSRNIVFARQVAIYLCRNMLDIPYAAIGKKFGQRDHSTIMHSVKLIEDRMRSSREMQEEIEIITKMIRES